MSHSRVPEVSMESIIPKKILIIDDEEGYEVCKKIRAVSNTPILFMSQELRRSIES